MELEANLTWGKARTLGWTREQYEEWLKASQGEQQQPATSAAEAVEAATVPPPDEPVENSWTGNKAIDWEKHPDKPWIEMRCGWCNALMLTKDARNDICEGCWFRHMVEVRDEAPKQVQRQMNRIINPFVGGDVLHSLYGSLPGGKK